MNMKKVIYPVMLKCENADEMLLKALGYHQPQVNNDNEFRLQFCSYS